MQGERGLEVIYLLRHCSSNIDSVTWPAYSKRKVTIVATSSPRCSSGTPTAAASRTRGSEYSAFSTDTESFEICVFSTGVSMRKYVVQTHNVFSSTDDYIFDCPRRLENMSALQGVSNLRLSLIYKKPSRSRYPRSPVLSHPSLVRVAFVATDY